MPTGRCSGCGYSDSCKKVEVHVLACAGYRQRFAEAPGQCLDPAAEHARFKAEEDTREARAERRDQRLSDRFAEMDRLAAHQVDRWRQPPDILAD